MCLSFHIKKTLKIGKGGMVLTDDKDFVDWFRRARYEGRGWKTFYKDDNIGTMGWNMYMTPQEAGTWIVSTSELSSSCSRSNGRKRIPRFT